MRQFPQELVDLVIDDVADITDLGTCGLICRRCLPRSRKHLFSHINLSNADPSAIQQFLDLVDASETPILALVKSAHMHLVDGVFTEAHMERLHECLAIGDLRIHGPHPAPRDHYTPVEDEPFQFWLQTHVPRFGSACLSLTRFELVLTSDIQFCILRDIICSMPCLTHLRICSTTTWFGFGLLESGNVLPTDTFPPHLHALDIDLIRGTNLFFEWLLSYDKPPVFTSLGLGGMARRTPLAPIEAYLKYVSPKVESLSFSYWVDGGPLGSFIFTSLATETNFSVIPKVTYNFEDRILAHTNRLVHLSLVRQCPSLLVNKLLNLSSLQHLSTMRIETCHSTYIDWPSVDATLGTPRFATLQRVEFTDIISERTTLTAEVKALMPQASARGILADSRS
ncbi:hypothetical protein B0H11DRAFT_2396225 [Mycena galericulata]|nr:hypothetical protein B0H11DRAFT_2396225 [Mycena galericulata]